MLRQAAISGLLLGLALTAGARTRPHYGGVLQVEVAGDPLESPDGLARRLILDGLTALGPDGTVQPALAVNWQSDDSDHRWEFELRPGVHFQDGSPLTAAAVVMSLNAACNGNCPWTAVRAAGSAVVFTGDAPMPKLPALLAGDGFLIFLTVTADGQTPAGLVGTGPFELAGSNSGGVTLAANDNCWQGRPFADTVEIRGHRAIRDQWLDLSVGRADVAEVPAELLREARQQQLSVVVSPPAELLALEISDTGALASPSLRAAIAEAVDRGALFNVIFQKQGAMTGSLLPQSLTGYSFLFPTDRDLSKANALRGGVTPPPLTMSVAGDGAMQLAAQRIALNLREAGFNVRVTGAGNGTHTDLALRKLPIAGADPAAAMETLLRSAGQFAAVPQQAPAALYKAEREFLELDTLVPLLDLPRAYAIGGRVRDFTLRGDGTPDLADTSLDASPGSAP